MMEYNNKAVAITIRKLRIKNHQSQELLSSFAGIARSHLSMIESGKKQANFETLWKLSLAFDMLPHELVKLIEDEAKDIT